MIRPIHRGSTRFRSDISMSLADAVSSAITDAMRTEMKNDDRVVIFPHEICPVDGTVVEGHGVMDESYLTGEPFVISKAPGSGVFSGAINGYCWR